MKKQSLFVAVAAIMMAACSETDNLSVQNVAQQQSETAVGFDTYMGRSTRAGAVGEITTKEELQISNFGVFAYYTNGAEYPTDAAGTLKPDFMWNQKVEYDGDQWFYFPVKYWPNETTAQGGVVDSDDPTENNATAQGALSPDKVTFFAYAPYVDASTAGTVTPNNDGITQILTLNNTNSDPRISYKTPVDPLKTVDLLWGVVPTYKTKYSTVIGEQGGLIAGRPNYNLWKQKQDERIMFQFKHALAKLTIDVKGFFDDVPENGAHNGDTNMGDASDQSANNVAKDTKIVVEYVKLSTEKYSMANVLNLNNQTANEPEWESIDSYDADNKVNFTISGTQLANIIRYRTPSEATKAYAEQPRGVTKDAVALLANDASQEAFYGIIPEVVSGKENALWTVEVKYHVFTKDANLENGYSEITNVIKKENIKMDLSWGKHYTLLLRLGMTSVKFDATVEDWIDGGTTPADLPINVAVAEVTTAPLMTTIGTPSGTDTYHGSYAPVTSTTNDFEVENCKSIISIADGLQVTFENATSATDVSAAAATLNSDVDWIHYEGGNFIIEENRTSADRSGKVWVTYGGVNSTPVTVTQHGSNLVLLLRFDDSSYSQSVAYNSRGPLNYSLIADYRDSHTGSTGYIAVAKDANVIKNFNISTSWVKVTPSGTDGTGTIEMLSDNEDEVNSRSTEINMSYDGQTSSTITVIQTKKE